MRTTLPAGFEARPPFWRCPDVEEGLKSALGRLRLGKFLAATAALEYPPVHAHRHHEAPRPPPLSSLRQTGVAQARPELIEQRHGTLRLLGLRDDPTEPLLGLHHEVQRVAEQPSMPQQLARQQIALARRIAEREAIRARRRLKLLEERVGEVGLVGREVRRRVGDVSHGQVGLGCVGELDEGFESEFGGPHLRFLLRGSGTLKGESVNLHGNGEDRSVDGAGLGHHAVLQPRPKLVQLH